jgi:hypothetical protein
VEVEVPDDRRAGENQDAEPRIVLNEGAGDGAAAAQMAEAERVVALDQDPAIARGHKKLPSDARVRRGLWHNPLVRR